MFFVPLVGSMAPAPMLSVGISDLQMKYSDDDPILWLSQDISWTELVRKVRIGLKHSKLPQVSVVTPLQPFHRCVILSSHHRSRVLTGSVSLFVCLKSSLLFLCQIPQFEMARDMCLSEPAYGTAFPKLLKAHMGEFASGLCSSLTILSALHECTPRLQSARHFVRASKSVTVHRPDLP